MAYEPTSESRSVTLFCAEPLRPLACLVVDSLNARGWDVRLVSGPNARTSLRKSVHGPAFGLRVVCVPRPLHANELVQMRKVLDPYLRGELLIVPLLTPHEVIDQIERFGQPPRPVRASSRPSRMYFANPTLVETPVQPRRWAGYGLAGAAATAAACGVLYVGANPENLQMAHREAPPVQTEAVVSAPSRLIDQSVHSAVAVPSDLDWIIIDDEEELDYPEPQVASEPVTVRPKRPRAKKRDRIEDIEEEEEVIIIEDDEDEPIEEVAAPPKVSKPSSEVDSRFEEFESMLQEEPPAAAASTPTPRQSQSRTVTYDPFAPASSAAANLH